MIRIVQMKLSRACRGGDTQQLFRQHEALQMRRQTRVICVIFHTYKPIKKAKTAFILACYTFCKKPFRCTKARVSVFA
jgi:hypothetical protein